MKKTIVVFAAVVAAAGVAVAVAAATGSFDSGGGTPNQDRTGINGRARIYVSGTSPLHVRGAGFKDGERVRVTAKGTTGTSRRSVTASGRGMFVVRLTLTNGCDSVSVVAIGNEGSRASLNLSSFFCRS